MYVLQREEQEKILEKLVLHEVTDGGWTRRYRHPLTGEGWVLYAVHSERHGGYSVLRKEPFPDRLSDQLAMAFASGRRDDVVGLACDLESDYEKWPEVLDWLESERGGLETAAVETFVRSLSVLNPINRRSILGKHYLEVRTDYNHFWELAERAKKLIGAD